MSNINTNNTNDKTFLIILGVLCMCCVLFTLSASVALVVIANNEDVQKALDDLNNDQSPSSSPSSSPAPASAPAPDSAINVIGFPAGTSVNCEENDLMGSLDSVYRVSETGTLRHYPDDDIAASWDSDWEEFETIDDCEGLVLGAAMEKKVEEVEEEILPPHHCVLHENAETNYLNSFPSDHWPSRGFNSAQERWDHFYPTSILPSCTMKNNSAWDIDDDGRKEECENAKLTGGSLNGAFRNCQWEPK